MCLFADLIESVTLKINAGDKLVRPSDVTASACCGCHMLWLSHVVAVTCCGCHVLWLSHVVAVTCCGCHMVWLSHGVAVTCSGCHMFYTSGCHVLAVKFVWLPHRNIMVVTCYVCHVTLLAHVLAVKCSECHMSWLSHVLHNCCWQLSVTVTSTPGSVFNCQRIVHAICINPHITELSLSKFRKPIPSFVIRMKM